MKLRTILPTLIATLLVSASVNAQSTVDPNLPGNTATDTWVDLPSVGSAGTANNAWGSPYPYASNGDGSTGTTYFTKTSGSGYVTSSNQVYTFFGAGTFSISSSEVLEGLQTIVFQISYGYATAATSAPTLSIGDGSDTYNLGAATNSLLSYRGKVESPVGEADGDIWFYQWDLSDYQNITDFTISFGFDANSHTNIYAMRVDQGDTYQAVPEPSTWALIGVSLIAGGAHLRRRRLSAA